MVQSKNIYSFWKYFVTGKPGTKITGKDGQQYEIVVDPLTGKKYKK